MARDYLYDLDVGGIIILTWILEKYDVRTRLLVLRAGLMVGWCDHGNAVDIQAS
jgi:hypothetical protein